MRLKLITREDVEKRRRNKRDAHSRNTRLASFDNRERRRAKAERAIAKGRIEVPEEWGLFAIAGNKGAGKSMVMVEDSGAGLVRFGPAGVHESGRGVRAPGYGAGHLQRAGSDAGELDVLLWTKPISLSLQHRRRGRIATPYSNRCAPGLRKKNQKLWIASSQMGNIDPGDSGGSGLRFRPAAVLSGRRGTPSTSTGRKHTPAARGAGSNSPESARSPGGRGGDRPVRAVFKMSVDGPPPKKMKKYIEPRRIWQVIQSVRHVRPAAEPA